MIVRALFALILILCLPLAARAQAPEKRVALIIANANYQNTSPLTNPQSDAKAMAATLVKIGFAVDPPKLNLNQAAMVQALTAFAAKARDADVAVVYYAGHGLEIEGKNYLIPVDAKFDTANDVDEFTAVSLDLVLKSVGRAKRLKLVILDACRNNPFASKWKLAPGGGKTRDFGARGLAPVSVEGDTLVAFAAEAGTTAQDGPKDGNSPFVRALTKFLPEPGVDIRIALGKVRDEVLKETKVQRPFTYGSIGGQEIYLVSKVRILIGSDPSLGKKPGDSFRDCPDCPEMVIVPSGSFIMGSPPEEEDSEYVERPQHRVTISKPLAVGKFEISEAEWQVCVTDGFCIRNARGKSEHGESNTSVTNVAWVDAKRYVNWLNGLPTAGRNKYRLLSEAEWEYVARAGSTGAYPWDREATRDFANYGPDTGLAAIWCQYSYKCEYFVGGRDRWPRSSPRGSFPANAFGLHDLHGNMWEWTEDCWHSSYEGAPNDGSAWKVPRYWENHCSYRVMRGGGWRSHRTYMRNASRTSARADVVAEPAGFRVARTL